MRWAIVEAAHFGSVRAEWDRLNRTRSPVLASRFVAPLLREFGEGCMLAVGGDPARPAALFLVQRDSSLGWSTFQPSQAPLGLAVAEAPLADLLPGLLRALPGYALTFGLTQQDPDLQPRPAERGVLRNLDYIDTARVRVDGTFDAYWGARGRNLRKNLKRQRNGLEREGVEARLETVTDPGDVAEAIAQYGVLETAGWKASGGTAVAPDNDQGRAYRSLLEDFCAEGAGRIYRYRYGDAIVAMDLCIEQGGTLVILKTTYDESIRTSSPAMLMREESFRAIFDEGRVETIEFYGKVMEWHTKWSEDIRTLYHVTCYRWPALGTAHGWAQRLRRGRGKPAAAPA